ncbi:MAG: DoxX family protein [Candidatus Saccharimonadales bacterium]
MYEIHLPELLSHFVLLLVRIVVGLAFFVSARNIFKDIKKFAKNNEIPIGLSYFVAIAELAGSLGLLTGVLAPWAAAGLMLLMLGTITLHVFKWKSPYWANKGGWEYDLLLFTLCSTIFFYGTGAIVVPYWIL